MAGADVWPPEFEPAWPEFLPTGMVVGRSMVTQKPHDESFHDDDADPVDDVVEFKVMVGAAGGIPRFAFLGDITVQNPIGFAAITVIMPIELRDEPEDLTDEEANEVADKILLTYGRWVAGLLYDYGATNLRAALTGNGLVRVPYATPRPTLVTSAIAAGTEAPED